jgi:DNA-directed RNA polymerase I subunit RPA2
MAPEKGAGSRERKIYPSEVLQALRRPSYQLTFRTRQSRERLATYASKMTAKLSWSVNGGPVTSETRDLGNLPMMVRVRLSRL